MINNIFVEKNQRILLFFSAVVSLTLLALFIITGNTEMRFLLIPVFIFAVILFFLSQSNALYLLVFSLPIIHWNFYVGSMEIPFVDLLAVLLLVSFFIKNIFTEGKELKTPFLSTFLIFYGAVFLSSLFSQNINESIWYSIRWILFFYLAYIVVPVNLIKNRKILRNTLFVFLISGIVVSLMGYLSLLTQDWQNTLVRIKPLPIFGVYPIGRNQNLIVEVLLPAIFFGIALKNSASTKRKKDFYSIAIVFITVALMGTFSRGAWISLFVTLLIYFAIKLRKHLVKILPIIVLASFLLFPAFLYMSKLQNTFDIGISSTQSRWLLTQISLKSFKDNPMFGVGPGNYIYEVAQNIRFRAKYGDPIEAHGVLQKVLSEMGIIGMLGFLIFVGTIFYSLLKKYLKTYDRRILLPLILSGLSIFIFEIFNTSYYKGKLWLPIALAIAYLYILNREQYGEEN